MEKLLSELRTAYKVIFHADPHIQGPDETGAITLDYVVDITPVMRECLVFRTELCMFSTEPVQASEHKDMQSAVRDAVILAAIARTYVYFAELTI